MSVPTILFLCVTTGLSLAVGLTVLLAGSRERLGLGRLALALTVVVLLALFEVGATAAFLDFFLSVHVAHLHVFVVVPLAGLVMLGLRYRALNGWTRAAAILGLALVPIGIYASFVEPLQLVTEQQRVLLARAPAAPLRVSVLADLQFKVVTEREREAVRRAMDFDPHLILLPGDVLQVHWDEYQERLPTVRELLAPLDAPLGVFFVPGNVDPRRPAVAAALFVGTRVRLLDNEIVTLEHEGTVIRLGGVDLDFSPAAQTVFEDLARAPGDELRLLLAHRPDAVLALPDPARVDLVVAGHTHGGQVNLPGFGPPITLSDVPRSVAAGGLHDVAGHAIYVSRGVGCERANAPRVRFNAPPEVSWLTLERPATEAQR